MAKSDSRFSPTQFLTQLAEQRRLWEPLITFDPWSRPLRAGSPPHSGVEAWLLTWLPGQGTEWHDHGGSAGAFLPVRGALTERQAMVQRDGRAADPARRRRPISAGLLRPFGTKHVHRVTNQGPRAGGQPARVRPALLEMNEYAADGDRLRLVARPAGRDRAGERAARPSPQVLDAARAAAGPASTPEEAQQASGAPGRWWSTSGRPPSGPPRVSCRALWWSNGTSWSGASTPPATPRLDIADHDLAGDRALPGGLHLEPRRRRAAGARGVAGDRCDRRVCGLAAGRMCPCERACPPLRERLPGGDLR